MYVTLKDIYTYSTHHKHNKCLLNHLTFFPPFALALPSLPISSRLIIN